MEEVLHFNKIGVETGNIGNSTLSQTIPYIFVGNKKGAKLIVQCAIHAREHITSLFALCLAKHLVATDKVIDGGIYIIPMVNVDGVRLCQEGCDFVEDKNIADNLLAINGSNDFSLWKANARGVDLNVNFDAQWGQGATNTTTASSANYIGECPLSEAESRALCQFTMLIKPDATLSYHCKGKEIYWQFNQQGQQLDRDYKYAKAIAKHTGYTLVEGSRGSCGGYKDWCIQQLAIPSYTIEVGDDSCDYPYPYTEIDNILQQNINLPRRLLNTIARDKYGARL